MSELEQFANLVHSIRAGRSRVIWPKHVKAEALHLMKSGVAAADLHQATKISEFTFKEWLHKRVPKKNVVELAIKAEPETGLLVTLESRGISIHLQNLSISALLQICHKVL
jgi:hypothetical protein